MGDRAENFLLATPGLLLLAFGFVLPIFQMLIFSVWKDGSITFEYFAHFLSDSYYLGIFWRTVRISLVVTLVCTLVGFPLAYLMARLGQTLRLLLVVMIILPLMTSVVIRTFGWMVLLNRSGLITGVLNDLGLVGRSFSLMHTETAIVMGLVQVLLPFMAMSILGVILRIDRRLEECARTMGCSFLQTIRTVVLPLSLPGIVAGSLLTFTLSASSFVTPSLLGGVRLQVLAGSIYNSVTQTLDWSFAAAQAVILFAGIILIVVPYMKFTSRSHG